MIGFEKLLYFVEESEGEVVVTVGVQSGTLSGEVVVRLSTNSDTATGECYYSFEIFTPLHFSLKFSPFSLPLFFLPLSSSPLSLLSFSLFFLPLLPPSLSLSRVAMYFNDMKLYLYIQQEETLPPLQGSLPSVPPTHRAVC